MLLLIGFINIIYGIGALDDANYFVNDTRFVLDNLDTLGWVLIVLGIIQLTGGFSLMAGNTYGRVIGSSAAASARSGRYLDRRKQTVVVAPRLRPLFTWFTHRRLRRRRADEGEPPEFELTLEPGASRPGFPDGYQRAASDSPFGTQPVRFAGDQCPGAPAV